MHSRQYYPTNRRNKEAKRMALHPVYTKAKISTVPNAQEFLRNIVKRDMRNATEVVPHLSTLIMAENVWQIKLVFRTTVKDPRTHKDLDIIAAITQINIIAGHQIIIRETYAMPTDGQGNNRNKRTILPYWEDAPSFLASLVRPEKVTTDEVYAAFGVGRDGEMVGLSPDDIAAPLS